MPIWAIRGWVKGQTVSLDLFVDAVKLDVFPNPNAGVFEVKLKGGEQGRYQLKVMDLTGKVLREEELDAPNGSFQKRITLDAPATGIYLLQIQSSQGQKTVKFFVR